MKLNLTYVACILSDCQHINDKKIIDKWLNKAKSILFYLEDPEGYLESVGKTKEEFEESI